MLNKLAKYIFLPTKVLLNKLFQRPLLLTLVLFSLSVIFVGLRGNFAINDDWIFVRQVEAFSKIGWTISSAIDPSFIAQGLLGHYWSNLFGLGFESLRVLTILVTVGFLYIVSKTLDLLGVGKKLKLVSLLLVIFNPLIFTSAFTFMTENYYLLFYTASIYFFLKHIKDEQFPTLVFGALFAGLALLTRQMGIVLFVAYLITALYFKKLNFKRVGVILIFFTLSFIVYSFWPRFLGGEISDSISGLLSNLISPEDYGDRLKLMLWSMPYFSFFLLPLAFYKRNWKASELKPWMTLLLLGTFYLLANWLYKMDVFPVGSVYYLEGLHGKSNFKSHFSIFNNILFKNFLVTFIAFASIRFLLLFDRLKKLKPPSLFLLMTFLGSFTILFLGNDYYDRYLLPSFVSLIFFFVYYFKDSIAFKTKFQIFALVTVIVLAVLPQHEFMSHTRLRWEQALNIQGTTSYVTSIFVEGTYAKYFGAVKTGDYTGSQSGDPKGNHVCYVEKYTVEQGNLYFKFSNSVDKLFKKHFDNPDVYGARRNAGLPKIKKHFDEVLYNEEYFSPIYNLIGKTAYVGSWCNVEK